MDVDHSCDMRAIDKNYCYMDSSFNNKAKRNYIHPCVQSLKAVVTAGLCLTLAASGVAIATATLSPQQAFAQEDESDTAIIQFKDQNLKNALLARMKELKLIDKDATDITIKQAKDAAETNGGYGIGVDARPRYNDYVCSKCFQNKHITDLTGLKYFLKNEGFSLDLSHNDLTDISPIYNVTPGDVNESIREDNSMGLHLEYNNISEITDELYSYIKRSSTWYEKYKRNSWFQHVFLGHNHIFNGWRGDVDIPQQSFTIKVKPRDDDQKGYVFNLQERAFDLTILYRYIDRDSLRGNDGYNIDVGTMGHNSSGNTGSITIEHMPRDYKVMMDFKTGYESTDFNYSGTITLDFSDYAKKPYKMTIERYLALDASTQKSVKFTNADKDSRQKYTDAIAAVRKLDIANATIEDVQDAATELGYAYDGLNGVPGASADNTALTELTNAIKALNDNNQKLTAAIEELKKSKSDTPAGQGDSSKDQKIAELTKQIEELQKKVEALSKGQGGTAGGGSSTGGSNPSQGGTAGGGSTQGGTNPSQGGSSTGGSGEGNTPAGGGTSQGGSTQGGTSQGGSSTGSGSTSGNTSGTTSGSGSTSGAVLGGFSVGSIGAASEDKSDTCMLYRLYNPYTHEHLFTIDKQEKENCAAHGWRDEGAVGKVLKEKGKEVYRLYNPYTGEHHFTTDVHEVELRSKEGWVNEGVQFHSADKDSSGAMGMVSFFNPYEKAYTHHYTSDAQEMAKLRAEGWKQEVAKWYCLPVTEKNA